MAANIEGLNPAARENLKRLLAEAKKAGIPATVTSAHRTREEQERLFAGRAQNPFPVARPGTSKHETGLAVDISIPEKHRKRFNELAAQHQFEWFGPKDRVHFEFIQLPSRARTQRHVPNVFRDALEQPAENVFRQAAQRKPKITDPAPEIRLLGRDFETGQLVPVTQRKPTPLRIPGEKRNVFREALEQPAAPVPGRVPDIPLQQAGAADLGGLAGLGQTLLRGAGAVGRELGRPAAALTAAFNEIERRAQTARAAGERKMISLGPVALDIDIPGAVSDIRAGIEAGTEAFRKGEQPDVTFVSDFLRVKPETTNPTLFGVIRAAEQLTPFVFDPLNLVAPVAGQALAKGIGAVKGTIPRVRVLEGGERMIDTIIQPLQRNKENVAGTVRRANTSLKALRAADPSIDAAVKQSGEHIVFELARQAAVKGVRLPAQNLGPAGRAVMETAQSLADDADDVLKAWASIGKDPLKGTTKAEWMEAMLAIGNDGLPVLIQESRAARRAVIFRSLSRQAADKGGPGLAQVPKVSVPGTSQPLYGNLSGKYLPANVVRKLKEIAGEGVEPGGFEKVATGAARVTKNLLLFQPWTPIKNVIQNTAGLGVMMSKLGGTTAEAGLKAPSAFREVWTFLAKGDLSPAIRELSDVDPSFLQALGKVKVADGVAGKFVRVGGKAIPLPGAQAVREALLPTSSEHVFLKANQAGDLLTKLTLYKTLRARGFSPNDAVQEIGRHVVTYGVRSAQVPEMVAQLDRFGVVLFANVPFQLAKQALDTAVRRPDLLARPGQLQERLLKAFGAEEAFEQKVPEERKSPFVIPGEAVGQPGKFVDIGQLSPLGAPQEMLRALLESAEGGRTIPEALKSALSGTSGTPLASLAFNQPIFTGPESRSEVIRGGTAPGNVDESALEFIRRQYGPLPQSIMEALAAAQGRVVRGGAFAEPETLGGFAVRKLGAPAVRTETFTEQRAAGAPRVRGRVEATRPAWQEEWEAAKQVPLDRNPDRARLRRMSQEDARFAFRDARNEVTKLLRDPALVDAQGRVTKGGRERIRRQALWLKGLADRLREGR